MRRGIRPLPRVAAASDGRAEWGGKVSGDRFLLFQVAGDNFAVPVEFLREVVGAEQFEMGSNRPERECEIMMHQGLLIPALDLGVVFGYGPGRRGAESRVLVGEGSGRRLGLVVDRVSDVAEATPRGVLPWPQGASALPAPCFRGIWCREEGVALILDPEGLAGLECVQRAVAAAGPPTSGGTGGPR